MDDELSPHVAAHDVVPRCRWALFADQTSPGTGDGTPLSTRIVLTWCCKWRHVSKTGHRSQIAKRSQVAWHGFAQRGIREKRRHASGGYHSSGGVMSHGSGKRLTSFPDAIGHGDPARTCVLVFTTDATLIDTVRKASPRDATVIQASELDQVSDQLASVQPDVLVLDAAGALTSLQSRRRFHVSSPSGPHRCGPSRGKRRPHEAHGFGTDLPLPARSIGARPDTPDA